uniref:NADH dehydrogenase subunit 4L n=1 Tax=Cryptocaryon irritans TaxID=153251 RepID=UPI0022FD4587|nr:NADH dehydrogenase subunit 4L [Cryptocaryon irritans]WBP62337.1 NADH dehydrogenase subunit 4L [Cryptocaryon irritans]
MHIWLNFWNFFFFLSVSGFIINSSNFINLLFYSEFIWVILYCYSILLGGTNDDLNIFSTSFFLLGLAGLEFSIGFLLIINFKNLNKELNFINEIKFLNQFVLNKNRNLSLVKKNWKF